MLGPKSMNGSIIVHATKSLYLPQLKVLNIVARNAEMKEVDLLDPTISDHTISYRYTIE